MPREVLVGVDLGTTVLKAAAFDRRTGRMLAGVERRLAVSTGPDGKREQEPGDLLRALRSLLKAVRKGISRPVAGVGLAAQGGSTLIADRRTGEAHTPLVLWNDRRAASYSPRVAAKVHEGHWRSLTWRDEPGMGLARMLWLKETRPGLFAQQNIYAGAGEYVYFNMTGLWRQDAGNALQIGCYNAPERRLDAGLLDLVDVDVSFVARMREGHEVHPLSKEGARFTGLPQGTPVAGPYIDQEAGYLAAAALSGRPLQCSLGTAWVGNFVLPQEARWSSPFQLVLPAPCPAGGAGGAQEDGGWLVVQPLRTGNVTWDWGLETLIHPNRKRALAESDGVFGEALLPPEGLAALPWLNVANPFWPSVTGGGAFFGVGPHTSRADMLRALAAGMTYEMARVLAEVKETGAVDRVVLGGGATRGVQFRRLFAALFDPLPVSVFTEEGWAGARGVLYALSPEVARAEAKRVKPVADGDAAEIRRRYGRYLELFESLYGRVQAGGALSFAPPAEGIQP